MRKKEPGAIKREKRKLRFGRLTELKEKQDCVEILLQQMNGGKEMRQDW